MRVRSGGPLVETMCDPSLPPPAPPSMQHEHNEARAEGGVASRSEPARDSPRPSAEEPHTKVALGAPVAIEGASSRFELPHTLDPVDEEEKVVVDQMLARLAPCQVEEASQAKSSQVKSWTW